MDSVSELHAARENLETLLKSINLLATQDVPNALTEIDTLSQLCAVEITRLRAATVAIESDAQGSALSDEQANVPGLSERQLAAVDNAVVDASSATEGVRAMLDAIFHYADEQCEKAQDDSAELRAATNAAALARLCNREIDRTQDAIERIVDNTLVSPA